MISKLNPTGLSAGFGASLVTSWKGRKRKGVLVGQALPAGGWDPKHFCRYPKAEGKNYCFMGKTASLKTKQNKQTKNPKTLHVKVSSAVQIPANVAVLLEKCLSTAGNPHL